MTAPPTAEWLSRQITELADRNFIIELSEDASKRLTEHSHDEQMGARPMTRVIQSTCSPTIRRSSYFVRVRI